MSTFTVTNTNNSDAGSLRQAVLDANALSGKDIINFSGLFDDGLAHTISLTSSGLSITDNLTIEGTNPSLLTIKDDTADRVFDIGKGVTAAINGLTITNSYNGASGGGAISNEGSLTLSNSIITGNTVYGNDNTPDIYGILFAKGGGIYNTGSLTVNYSTISGNQVITSSFDGGGGIYNTGSLTVNYSTINDNATLEGYGNGGGIYNTGTLNLSNSTISGNYTKYGGGIYNTGSLTVDYSTISGNQATSGGEGSGGGIFSINSSIGSAILTLNHSTITGNKVITSSFGGGAGIENGGSLTLNYSTINGNQINGGNGAGIENGGSLTLNYSTISDNTALNINSISEGGGIFNNQNFLETNEPIHPNTVTVINNSTISGNTAQEGGGIYNYGAGISFGVPGAPEPIYQVSYGILAVSNSTISDNHATTGGGIYNNGILSVSHSTINDNHASVEGGGIYNSSSDGNGTANQLGIVSSSDGNGSDNQFGIVTVSYSSISSNTAGVTGGGIYNNADDGGDYSGSIQIDQYQYQYSHYYYAGVPSTQLGIVTVSDSIIADNQAHFGGGIYNDATLTVGNSTITHNKAFGIELSSGREESGKGGGIYNSSSSYATATVDYSTIACNFDIPQEDSTKVIKSDDLVGKFISKGHDNWIGNLSGSTFSYN
ncbi:MAG: hypothetical protein V7K86_12450 [Nostoc sp.]|uniref:beta strand repeat-containing protein n=1 Tax=Nostoc sp. TaxID=1180 RepID=UPI002FF67E3E